MGGFDILFDRDISHACLQEAISQVMNIAVSRVILIEDVAAYPTREESDCVCIVRRAGGQFFLHAAIDYEEKFWAGSSADCVVRLASFLQCNCLISDESVNPYRMIHVSRAGALRAVFVDVVALDQRGEYNVDASSAG
ncbi:MAG: hypothetical protein NTV86_04095 [Planctomycetota bacterium]|nr:hypothetical protein [Planctomycetota bacterium]